MQKLVIAMNIGSTSKKYAIYRGTEKLLDLRIEKRDSNTYVATDNFHEEALPLTQYEYNETLSYLGDIIRGNEFGNGLVDVEAILMRIVAPGEYFQKHRIMDEEYFSRLERAAALAPLHLALQREEYDQAKKTLAEKGFADSVKIWGISDSAFHSSLPVGAYKYGIARADAGEFELRRFGYHGLSCAALVSVAKDSHGATPSRIIIAHLGGGASVTGVKDGVSIETSMGMTPLEGLLMARRSGDVDPGVLLALMEAKGWGIAETRVYLNTECGLAGVSGGEESLKALLDRADAGDAIAREAVDVYVHHVRKYVGAALVQLGGCDLFIFAGASGERSARVRARILAGMRDLGIDIDEKRNQLQGEGREDGFIESPLSRTSIAVMHTDEFRAMIDAYLNSK